MNVRRAWYWPTPVTRGELAGQYDVVEGRCGQGPVYRLLVHTSWVPVTPLPTLEGLPDTEGFFCADLEDRDRGRVAVLVLPSEEAFFGAELAARLALTEGLEVFEESPASHVDYRAVARGNGKMGFLSVVQERDQWHCLFGVGPEDDHDELDAVRAAWATFHVIPR